MDGSPAPQGEYDEVQEAGEILTLFFAALLVTCLLSVLVVGVSVLALKLL